MSSQRKQDRAEIIYGLYGTSNHLLFTEENILNYCPGGYHPVSLGDTLSHGRYRIIHKLGFGGFSTVWLAKDLETEQWVSVKIITAQRSNQSPELSVLQALRKRLGQCPGSGRIVQLLDYFFHRGPNGNHQCLVFELLGPTIAQSADIWEEMFDSETVLRLSTQLLQAVASLHEVGYAHGDVNTGNIALVSKHLSRMSETEVFKVLGKPETENLSRVDGEALQDGVPKQLIKSADWSGWPIDDDDDDENIRLIDMGEAFLHDFVPERLAQPAALQAPETIFTGKFDYTIDLWRAGLIIYYFAFGFLPFQRSSLDSLIESMVDFIGELPLEWEVKLEQIGRYIGDEKVIGKNILLLRSPTPLTRMEWHFKHNLHDPELEILLPVIRGLTRFLPSQRISAAQALDILSTRDTIKCESDISDDDPGL